MHTPLPRLTLSNTLMSRSFEPQQDMYAEPQFTKTIFRMFTTLNILSRTQSLMKSLSGKHKRQYDEESAVKHHVRYERNRQRQMEEAPVYVSKNHNSEDYNENQNYEYQEYSQNRHEQYRNDR